MCLKDGSSGGLLLTRLGEVGVLGVGEKPGLVKAGGGGKMAGKDGVGEKMRLVKKIVKTSKNVLQCIEICPSACYHEVQIRM